jgi:hypothetical protein
MSRLIPLLTLSTLAACAGASTDTVDDADTVDDGADDVLEIAIRRLNEGQEVDEFEAARDAFVERLRAQPGVGTDREFGAFLDFVTFAEPSPPVFTGMTQYGSLDAFQDAGTALGESAEAGAFFSTFAPAAFTVLQPLDEYGPLDLATIAADADDVLEVAVRDLSTYAAFDATAYANARDAFLGVLTAQPGVVREYQWVSVLDPNVVVGMTVYEDAAAFQTVATDPAVAGSNEAAAFLGSYPPIAGFAHAVVR